MAAQQQSLVQWVEQINDTLFIQPDNEISAKAVEDLVDPSLITKINHNVYNYEQFKGGLQYVRNSTTATQDVFKVLLQWENPEKPDGVVAVLSEWRVKDNATGKETKKVNIILWEVKWIDGKRKLTGQTEVEAV
ncbi:hypothetical protein BKA66DRAFT_434334 [Pyrenochaeta sp. MPI-SDFR-AT-0127]|nr:hypothetical protein BKA66DRAFT_434334 [Pyrenochaeta sp. MPI-SDFR-AT-0127]